MVPNHAVLSKVGAWVPMVDVMVLDLGKERSERKIEHHLSGGRVHLVCVDRHEHWQDLKLTW